MKKNKMRGIGSPVDPVFRIPDLAVDDKFLVERAMIKLQQFEADRALWLDRREEYYLGWDDYLTPVAGGLWEGSSNVHLPMTEIQCNQMHARVMQSIFFVNPPFFSDPQEDIDEMRLQKIEKMLKYILMRYCNFNKGIYSAIDDWAWDLTTDGIGILSRDWMLKQERYLKVFENPEYLKYNTINFDKIFQEDVEMEEFADIAGELLRKPYAEKFVVRTVFNGPTVTAEDPSYILFKGDVVDATDLNEHETVLKVCYFSADELIAFKESEYMDEEVVDEILSRPADKKGSTIFSARRAGVNAAKDYITGVQTNNSNYEDGKYEFICAYDKVALSGKRGDYADRLVYMVHPASRKLARWTFLDRIVTNGKIPLHMAHLYRRPRRSMGRGLVETQMPINEVQDILLNQSIDAGTLANNPMGLYRGNGTFDPDEFQVGPGVLYKTDDPNSDVRLLTWPINPNWSMPIQQLLSGVSSQLTSLGPQASGQVAGPVGPMRSNAGLQSLFGQTDINLDVIFKRINFNCISDLFEGLYQDCVERMPEYLKISVIGMDGLPELDDNGMPLKETVSKADLRGKVHFGLYANSQNMNKQLQLQMSMQMSQALFQRAPMELGVVGPNEVYNVLDDLLTNMGKLRKDRFIKKPQNYGAVPFQVELFAIAQGVLPPIVLADPEHEQKVQQYDELINSEQSQLEARMGVVHKDAIMLMQAAQKKHQSFLQILQQAQNMNNPTGSNVSPTLGLQEGQSPAQEGGANAEPPPPQSAKAGPEQAGQGEENQPSP